MDKISRFLLYACIIMNWVMFTYTVYSGIFDWLVFGGCVLLSGVVLYAEYLYRKGEFDDNSIQD